MDELLVNFIEKIIILTKERKIRWSYLDSNRHLYESMSWTHTSSGFEIWGVKNKITPDFNTEESFYSTIDDTYLVIYTRKDKLPIFCIIPNTFKKIVYMYPDKYGQYITRLSNLVQSQFPDAQTFIQKFISKEE